MLGLTSGMSSGTSSLMRCDAALENTATPSLGQLGLEVLGDVRRQPGERHPAALGDALAGPAARSCWSRVSCLKRMVLHLASPRPASCPRTAPRRRARRSRTRGGPPAAARTSARSFPWRLAPLPAPCFIHSPPKYFSPSLHHPARSSSFSSAIGRRADLLAWPRSASSVSWCGGSDAGSRSKGQGSLGDTPLVCICWFGRWSRRLSPAP